MPTIAEQLRTEMGFDPATLRAAERRACPICSHSSRALLAQQERYGFSARYFLCMQCSVVYADPQLTSEGCTKLYDGVYRRLITLRTGVETTAQSIQAEQRRYAERLVDGFLAGSVSTHGRCLDIGGSSGCVSERVLQVLGLRPTVLDPSRHELAEARAKGLDVMLGFAEHLDFQDQSFDLVLVCQTIDHLQDPLAVLQSVRRVLSPGGRLFVDIADFKFLVRSKGSPTAALKIDHPFAFTRWSADALLRFAGFRVVALWSARDHIGFLCEPAPASTALPEAGRAEAISLLDYIRDAEAVPKAIPSTAPPASLARRLARKVRRLATRMIPR